MGKAMNECINAADGVEPQFISEQDEQEVFCKKYPQHPDFQYIQPKSYDENGNEMTENDALKRRIVDSEDLAVTQDEVSNTIQLLKRGKSTGPSGITADILKFLNRSYDEFPRMLTHFYNMILKNPDIIKNGETELLYTFRSVFIPKPKSNDWRPLAVCE